MGTPAGMCTWPPSRPSTRSSFFSLSRKFCDFMFNLGTLDGTMHLSRGETEHKTKQNKQDIGLREVALWQDLHPMEGPMLYNSQLSSWPRTPYTEVGLATLVG